MRRDSLMTPFRYGMRSKPCRRHPRQLNNHYDTTRRSIHTHLGAVHGISVFCPGCVDFGKQFLLNPRVPGHKVEYEAWEG
jgi:hypothetical protein